MTDLAMQLAFAIDAILRATALVVSSFAILLAGFGAVAYPRAADYTVNLVVLIASIVMAVLAVMSFRDRRLRWPTVAIAALYLPLVIAALRGDFS